MRKIGVLGAGTWGIALARMLSKNGHQVTVWSAIGEEIDQLRKSKRHPNLPNMELPDQINYTKEIKAVCTDKDILLFAVPSIFIRSTARQAKTYIKDGQVIVNVAKGIESHTHYTMTQVIYDELNKDEDHCNVQLVTLSGPTHAEEVSMDMPTTIVSACSNIEVAEQVQDIFMGESMRVYTNSDVQGVEISGSLKNIIALAAGISDGLGYGDNAKAALITRGVAEITRLGVAMGCMEQTFFGLTGVGDMIVTATSKHSRNNKAGYLIGKGYSPEEAKNEVGMVVEGINALPAAIELAKLYDIEMPIIESVYRIVEMKENPSEIAKMLITRKKRMELSTNILDLNYENSIIKKKRGKKMKRVITYGTFDLLHYGHINLLKRARALGDYLIVAISTDEFNWNKKQKKCYFTYEQRKALVEAVRYVDLVIPEESWEQKKTDVKEYHVDTFVMGDDWKGKFDFLKEEGVEVVYLPRTPEISTTQIKKDLNNKQL